MRREAYNAPSMAVAPPPPTPTPIIAEPDQPSATPRDGGGGAKAVALGILASRLLGLVRDQVTARYFGVGPHADVFRVALRAPNVLQNLLGEGTLSAAFIPIYSRMLEEGRREDAGRFAGAIFGLLLAAASVLVLLGVLLARPLVAILAAGFLDDAGPVDRYELTVATVRIIFPMTGILVLSAWALGVLNSHRRFLLPYVAPALWNAAIIGALLWTGGLRGAETFSLAMLERLLFAACWGALLGGLLQLLVQLPLVAREMRGFRLSCSPRVPGVSQALGAFGPAVAGRGVVQLASYVDTLLASLLIQGAVSALGYAQTLYTLPISLFGMSVAAAELPEMARLRREGDASASGALLSRVHRSLRQSAFLNVPTCVGFLLFGFLIVGAIYRTFAGQFGVEANWLVYLVLGGYSVGLIATTSSRLLQNTFYALGDTRAPARVATLRVVAAAALGFGLMLWLDKIPVAEVAGLAEDEGRRLGAVGLAVASGVASWLELLLLRRALARSLSGSPVPWRDLGRLVLMALAAALAAGLLWLALPDIHVAIQGLAVVGTYAAMYLLLARLTGAEELGFWLGRFGRRLRR